ITHTLILLMSYRQFMCVGWGVVQSVSCVRSMSAINGEGGRRWGRGRPRGRVASMVGSVRGAGVSQWRVGRQVPSHVRYTHYSYDKYPHHPHSTHTVAHDTYTQYSHSTHKTHTLRTIITSPDQERG